jgi:hypothetical protein
MSKLFHKKTETPVNGNYYYLIRKYGTTGNIIGEGEWEDENECFYDNNEDKTYHLSEIDYYMEMPKEEQLDNL